MCFYSIFLLFKISINSRLVVPVFTVLLSIIRSRAMTPAVPVQWTKPNQLIIVDLVNEGMQNYTFLLRIIMDKILHLGKNFK